MNVKLPSRRWGPFRQEFYSICSAHQRSNASCRTCAIGSWINVWQRRIGAFVFKRAPRLWRWWANFPSPKLKLEPRDHAASVANHEGPDVGGKPKRDPEKP